MVGRLNGSDERLAVAMSQAEQAISNRMLEVEHSPDHATEKQELAKAIEGLTLIKSVVLGHPEIHNQ